MPQVIEFPPLGAGADLRQTVASLVEVCKQTVEGEPLRALRTRLRGVGLWDRDRPVPILRLLGVGGDPVVARSPFMIKLGDAGTEDEQLDTLGDRLFELNPPLFKASLEQVAQRPLPKDELYRHISSFAYAGSVPSRPDFETWLQLALVVGALRQVGVAMLPGPRAERFTLAMREIDVEEYLAA
ncbi:MAG: hypothetical protein KC464_23645, partial [Myxococcales bacterium]|nr:hypothetical protein [Myxococcales bacterium]